LVEQKAGPGSETHPVGLENIAQTCYMNSLFQYYFSVRPLRNAILQFEEHEEGDLSEEDLKKKQISKWELQRSKRCNFYLTIYLMVVVAQLRILFQELITSHLAYIRPKEELVRLTLVDAKQEIEDAAEKRRQSLNTNKSQPTMDKNVPDLIEIEDTTVQDPPRGSPIIKPILDDDVPLMTSPVENSSESQPNVSDDHDYEFVEHETNEWPTFEPMSIDKENVPPLQQPVPRHSTSSKIPLQEILPDNVESTAMVEVEEKGDQEDAEMLDLPALITPPLSPPPIPQRPMRRRSTWGALKYGSQQDVTECITNCLSQLHAAFKAEELGPGGDQIDLFKRYTPLHSSLTKGYSIFESGMYCETLKRVRIQNQ
jgi:ubiquitin carboxyl-terminal hydrolase 25